MTLLFSMACSRKADTIRVGTYDNRAVAIAYSNSKYNDVSSKMEEFSKANEAGDTAKVRELEDWGAKHQNALHRQGFGRVPVDDLLKPVEDKISAMALQMNLDLIAWNVNYSDANVEIVDISLELAKLFEPSEQALGWIEDIKNQPPVDLDELEE
jgi:hypothetical protein